MNFSKVLGSWWVLHLGVAMSSFTWQVHAISSLLPRSYMTLIISAKASFPQASTECPIVFCSSRAVAVRYHQSIEHRWGSCDILSSLTKLFSWTFNGALWGCSGWGNVALCKGRAAPAHSLTAVAPLISPAGLGLSEMMHSTVSSTPLLPWEHEMSDLLSSLCTSTVN